MRLRWLSSGTTFFSPSSVFWRLMGALVLGVVLARWSWALFAPHATAVAVVPEHGATVETGQLFGKAASGISASGVSPSVGAALPNVHLVGVFAARIGQPGFAVLKLDDKQQLGVVVGGEVASGTRLLEVHPNYVLLERAGLQQRVNLEEKAATGTVVGTVPAAK